MGNPKSRRNAPLKNTVNILNTGGEWNLWLQVVKTSLDWVAYEKRSLEIFNKFKTFLKILNHFGYTLENSTKINNNFWKI